MATTLLRKQALSQLSRALGSEQATVELKWMLRSLEQPDRLVADSLSAMVARRVSGEPLQYILGTQPFGPLDLLTRPPVLIPRPETEDWAIRLAEFVKPTMRAPIQLLDLCTGSGCIPLLLCKTWPAGTVRARGIDISAEAIALAKDNAARCGIPSSSSKPTASHELTAAHNTFDALQADIRLPGFLASLKSSGIRPRFDVITSNPPYIPRDQYEQLPTSVKDYEDIRALLGDPDLLPPQGKKSLSDSGRGLTFYHDIAKLVAHEQEGLLTTKGILAVEVGEGQAKDVAAILKTEGGLQYTSIWTDPWNIERVVVASRK
ncbi:S-adenosyl-L-methionine-dependent methyltransferase [Irpex rosettiformis]|uniref:S-adenosyl-L-methionine-dependent methyltransferase n=1 Tax=Irpex rosettiformis TaxID=378272 RepID=A0ACB8UG40_9APHY|nr:S-adenosyl-L-methionine-dependent methyltransferase [Irpex rosettiformis]